jgi:dihydrofolate reductase
MAKYVVSSTLTDPVWNNTTVISGDPVAEIQRLKEAPGKNILQYGFGQLSFAMMEHRLLDELHLWVHPLFIGRAQQHGLLYRDSPTAFFDLVDTKILKNGIAILSYRYKNEQASPRDRPPSTAVAEEGEARTRVTRGAPGRSRRKAVRTPAE